MRFLYAAMALIFTLFAILQYNDPDAVLWGMAYLAAAVVTLSSALGRHTWIPLLLLPAYLIWFFVLAPTISPDWWQSEEAREALGMLLAALWMAVLGVAWWRSRRTEPDGATNAAGN